MVFELATFGLVLGIILGVYWLLIVRPESARESAVVARIGGTTTLTKTAALLKAPQRLSEMQSLDNVLARAGGLVAPLQRTIDQSGLKVTLGTILLASALTAALAFLLVHTFLHLTLVAAVVGALAACLPFGYVRHMRSKRLLKFEEQFPEAIDLLSRALRAGHALTTGLSMVAEELPDPIGPEFQTLYDQQNFGMPALAGAEELRRSGGVPGCTVLRHRRADAEGGGRKPFRGSRQPRGRSFVSASR